MNAVVDHRMGLLAVGRDGLLSLRQTPVESTAFRALDAIQERLPLPPNKGATLNIIPPSSDGSGVGSIYLRQLIRESRYKWPIKFA